MYCIGLMSGTSVDGIDAAVVNISGRDLDLKTEWISGLIHPYPPALRARILSLCGGASLSMAELAELDDRIAQEFARAALKLQKQQPQAQLIGSHGQTLFHRHPQQQPGGAKLNWDIAYNWDGVK